MIESRDGRRKLGVASYEETHSRACRLLSTLGKSTSIASVKIAARDCGIPRNPKALVLSWEALYRGTTSIGHCYKETKKHGQEAYLDVVRFSGKGGPCAQVCMGHNQRKTAAQLSEPFLAELRHGGGAGSVALIA
jgi:hypothetical protein